MKWDYSAWSGPVVIVGVRDYAPSLGRFISRDPIGYYAGVNVYGFCGGDPINRRDPFGLDIYDEDDGGPEFDNLYTDNAKIWANAGQNFAKDKMFKPGSKEREKFSNGISNLPVFGQANDAVIAATGYDYLAGVQVDGWRRGLSILSTGLLLAHVSGADEALEDAMASAKGGCFIAGTPVHVPAEGKKGSIRVAGAANVASIASTTKAIEKIKAGDKVFARDDKTGKTVIGKVDHVTVRKVDHTIDVALADASGRVVETLQTTRNHPFYVDGKGWLPAGGLGIGNAIVTRAGPTLVVKSLKWNRRPQGYTVYNFEVEALSGTETDSENTHSYFVGNANNGVWMHNSGNCLPGADGNGQLSLFTPEEPFNRMKHYGRTPTVPQKNSVPIGELFDHEPPLAQHYYEGDGKGGIPGFMMTAKDRMNYGKSLGVGKGVNPGQRFGQGGDVKAYSMRMRKYWFGY